MKKDPYQRTTSGNFQMIEKKGDFEDIYRNGKEKNNSHPPIQIYRIRLLNSKKSDNNGTVPSKFGGNMTQISI